MTARGAGFPRFAWLAPNKRRKKQAYSTPSLRRKTKDKEEKMKGRTGSGSPLTTSWCVRPYGLGDLSWGSPNRPHKSTFTGELKLGSGFVRAKQGNNNKGEVVVATQRSGRGRELSQWLDADRGTKALLERGKTKWSPSRREPLHYAKRSLCRSMMAEPRLRSLLGRQLLVQAGQTTSYLAPGWPC